MKQERPYRLFCNLAMTDVLEGMQLEEKGTPSRPGRIFLYLYVDETVLEDAVWLSMRFFLKLSLRQKKNKK